MTKVFLLVPLLALFLAAPAAAELTKIADNVYSYVGVQGASPANSFAANAGIVIGRDGILVVDGRRAEEGPPQALPGRLDDRLQPEEPVSEEGVRQT